MQATEGFLPTPDGVRLFYQCVGDGPQTLIIPNAAYMFDDFKQLSEGRTLIFYDPRNRGRSDAVANHGGIHQDVDDLDAVRRHFGVDRVTVLGHSLIGMMVILYAMKYAEHVEGVIAIGPGQPFPEKKYPSELAGVDQTMIDTQAKLAALTPAEMPTKWWPLTRQLFVVDPTNAEKINWQVWHLPNEQNLMKHLNESLMPSVRSTKLTEADFAKATMPILIIHGNRDRHAPYGGALDWAESLPKARLVTIENAAHLPWLEAPDVVWTAIEDTLTAGKNKY